MIKIIELIVVLALLVFSFFAGVKYSESVKQHAGWLFESKEDEVELPDLSNENSAEMPAAVDESGVNLENPNAAQTDGATIDASQPVEAVAPEAVASPEVAPTTNVKK